MTIPCTCKVCGKMFDWEDIGDQGPTPTICDDCYKKKGESRPPRPSRVTDAMDVVNPPYYKGREVMDIINRFKLTPCIAFVLKYILRYKEKNGVEDLKKAKWYLEEEIRIMEGGKAN